MCISLRRVFARLAIQINYRLINFCDLSRINGNIQNHPYNGDVELLDLTANLRNYVEVDKLHRQIHSEVVAGERPDTVIAVQYNPTFTAGRATKPQDVPNRDVPVIEIDRGGSVTWHGPGQLVCYPIVRLPLPLDVIAYIRSLEQCVIRVLQGYGIKGEVVPGRAGVWILRPGEQDKKICAMGVRTAKGVTMHGIALNVKPDLSDFGRIIPCGLADAGVTSMQLEGVCLEVQDLIDPLYDSFLTGLYRAELQEG